MIDVRYFASLRETLGLSHERVAVTSPTTVASLMQTLAEAHGGQWEEALRAGRVLVAVNQHVAGLAAPVQDGDEVAFFPPVTGG